MDATEFADKCISYVQCNHEVVKRQIKDKDIESLYSNVKTTTKLKTYITCKLKLMLSHLLNPILEMSTIGVF